MKTFGRQGTHKFRSQAFLHQRDPKRGRIFNPASLRGTTTHSHSHTHTHTRTHTHTHTHTHSHKVYDHHYAAFDTVTEDMLFAKVGAWVEASAMPWRTYISLDCALLTHAATSAFQRYLEYFVHQTLPKFLQNIEVPSNSTPTPIGQASGTRL